MNMDRIDAPESTLNISASGSPEFDYAPGQPNLYRMMLYKQSLVAESGVPKGFDAYREKFSLPRHTQLKALQLRSERDFAESNAATFIETGVAGEDFVNICPAIFDQGVQPAVSGTTRSKYVACFANARVRGRAAAVLVGDNLLLDFQGNELREVTDELDWDPSIFSVEKGRVWYIPATNEDDPITLPEAFSLLGAHTDFFGHWMIEYLPKYIAAALSMDLRSVPVLIDAHMPRSHRESLRLLYGDELEIQEIDAFRSVLVERLWVGPSLSYMPVHEKVTTHFNWSSTAFPYSRMAPAIGEMVRRAQASTMRSKNDVELVYLARKPFRHRRLINSVAIEGLAAAQGFQVVCPEDLSFAEQIGLVHKARRIVAQEGSAVYLAFFAPPGARLCILAPPIVPPLTQYSGMLDAQRIDITAIVGDIRELNQQTPNDSDYEVDAAKFSQFLVDWAA